METNHKSIHKMRFFRWFDLVEIYVHPSPTSEDSTTHNSVNHTHTLDTTSKTTHTHFPHTHTEMKSPHVSTREH